MVAPALNPNLLTSRTAGDAAKGKIPPGLINSALLYSSLSTFTPLHPTMTDSHPHELASAHNDIDVGADQDGSSSYIDYLAFLSPTFSPYTFANTLVLATNTPNDPNLDLSTPLSRVLFDLQEIDSHIHNLTSKSALPLLNHAKTSQEASTALVHSLEGELERLTATYKRLEAEVIQRAETANEVLLIVERLHETTSLLRQVTRALMVARQFESHMLEVRGVAPVESTRKVGELDKFRAMPKAAFAAVELHKMLWSAKRDAKLDEIEVVKTLKNSYISPAVSQLITTAQNAISGFTLPLGVQGKTSISSGAAMDEVRVKLSSSFQTLHSLSVFHQDTSPLLLKAIQSYINVQSTAILNSFARGGLTNPTQLDSTLADLKLRTQTVIFFEITLQSIPLPIESYTPPEDPDAPPPTLLSHMLSLIGTRTLPTYLFQTMAPGLETRIKEVITRGGANGRLIRAQKTAMKEGLRSAVQEGLTGDVKVKRSDAEVGICVGLIVGALSVMGK